MVNSPDLEVVHHMTANLSSPSLTVHEPLESLADASMHPLTRSESHPFNEVAEIAPPTSTDPSSAFCTYKPPTSALNVLETDSTGVTTEGSAQDTSASNQEYPGTPYTSGILSHSPKPDASIVRTESTDFQGATWDLKHASSNRSGESLKRKKSPSPCLSYPPAPLVVIPVPSRPVSLRRKSTRLSSNHLRNSDSTAGEPCESDSAPSDDEHDADYSNHSKIKRAGKSLRLVKCRRSARDNASPALRVSRQVFSQSPCAERPESPLEDLCVESEPIAIQGFLRLRSSGSEVIYCVEFSQTNLLPLAACRQIEAAQPHQQTVRPVTKIPYTPEEDAYIMELEAQELRWNEIEALFAQRFPYRKQSCLRARYYKLKPPLKSRKKRRVKNRV